MLNKDFDRASHEETDPRQMSLFAESREHLVILIPHAQAKLRRWRLLPHLPVPTQLLLPPLSMPRAAGRLFEFLELLLPKRLRDEELSDAREMVCYLVAAGAPVWKIYTKTFSTCFWCLLNALGYVVATVLGRSRNKS